MLDIRNKFTLGNTNSDIAAFSDRQDSTVKAYIISPAGEFDTLHYCTFKPGFKGEIYGFCLYRNNDYGKLYAVANSKEGEVEQWLIDGSKGILTASFIKDFKIPSQPEGMVADDETGILYIGEEDAGIWSVDLRNPVSAPAMIESGIIASNKNLVADIEGLALYYSENGGYLIASIQGNNSYALFNRLPPNNYIGSFRLTEGNTDSTEDTDGIEVINLPLNSMFPNGMLIAQDGSNTEANGKRATQNFKLVGWQKIASAFTGKIKVDILYGPGIQK